MKYGYARVSTDGQSVDAQVRQLTKAGCKKVFREVASGAKTDRAQLRRLLGQLEAGDVLMVTRLERRSPRLPDCGVEQRNATDEACDRERVAHGHVVGEQTPRHNSPADSGAGSMNAIEDFPLNTRVMAPLGDVLHRGIVAEPSADHPLGEGMIRVVFTPPVKAEEPFDSIDSIICPANRVTLGWF
jgi:hypothetical protein